MFEILPVNSPSVSTSIILTLVILVTYKLITLVKQYHRWVAIYDKLPGIKKKHWLWGHMNEHPGANEKGIAFQLSFTKLFPKLNCIWFGRIRPNIIIYHPDSLRPVLLASAHVMPKSLDPGAAYQVGIRWLGDGLLIANGDKWARNRRLLTPAFHFDILKPYVKVFNQCTDLLVSKIDKFVDSSQSFEAFQHIGLCSFDIITRCAFSYQTDCQIQGNPLLVIDWIYFNFTCNGWEFQRLCKYIHSVSEEIISKRRETLKEKQQENKVEDDSKRMLDFLDIILTATDTDGKGLTDLEIRNEVDTFLFEGHDTTTSALSFILSSLAQHPEIQERCYEEISKVMEDRENVYIEWKDLSQFEYLTQCIKEGLRLHSPVFFVQRKTTEDINIEGYSIPKGSNFGLDIYNLHHNEAVWGKDYDDFKPERFHPDNVRTMDTFAFLPFSAGQRNCIGQNFAMNEMKVTLARLIHRYKLSLKPGHVIKKKPGVVMRTEDGIWLNAKQRNKVKS